jgi:hypothetical protein
MIIVKATAVSESGVFPTQALVDEMTAYHEQLADAGVLVDASGLKPTAQAFRVRYEDGRRSVIDGPFAETKELIAGYTIIDVSSREDALAWALRFPNPHPGEAACEIEVRPFYELEDFDPALSLERFQALFECKTA